MCVSHPIISLPGSLGCLHTQYSFSTGISSTRFSLRCLFTAAVDRPAAAVVRSPAVELFAVLLLPVRGRCAREEDLACAGALAVVPASDLFLVSLVRFLEDMMLSCRKLRVSLDPDSAEPVCYDIRHWSREQANHVGTG